MLRLGKGKIIDINPETLITSEIPLKNKKLQLIHEYSDDRFIIVSQSTDGDDNVTSYYSVIDTETQKVVRRYQKEKSTREKSVSQYGKLLITQDQNALNIRDVITQEERVFERPHRKIIAYSFNPNDLVGVTPEKNPSTSVSIIYGPGSTAMDHFYLIETFDAHELANIQSYLTKVPVLPNEQIAIDRIFSDQKRFVYSSFLPSPTNEYQGTTTYYFKFGPEVQDQVKIDLDPSESLEQDFEYQGHLYLKTVKQSPRNELVENGFYRLVNQNGQWIKESATLSREEKQLFSNEVYASDSDGLPFQVGQNQKKILNINLTPQEGLGFSYSLRDSGSQEVDKLIKKYFSLNATEKRTLFNEVAAGTIKNKKLLIILINDILHEVRYTPNTVSVKNFVFAMLERLRLVNPNLATSVLDIVPFLNDIQTFVQTDRFKNFRFTAADQKLVLKRSALIEKVFAQSYQSQLLRPEELPYIKAIAPAIATIKDGGRAVYIDSLATMVQQGIQESSEIFAKMNSSKIYKIAKSNILNYLHGFSERNFVPFDISDIASVRLTEKNATEEGVTQLGQLGKDNMNFYLVANRPFTVGSRSALHTEGYDVFGLYYADLKPVDIMAKQGGPFNVKRKAEWMIGAKTYQADLFVVSKGIKGESLAFTGDQLDYQELAKNDFTSLFVVGSNFPDGKDSVDALIEYYRKEGLTLESKTEVNDFDVQFSEMIQKIDFLANEQHAGGDDRNVGTYHKSGTLYHFIKNGEKKLNYHIFLPNYKTTQTFDYTMESLSEDMAKRKTAAAQRGERGDMAFLYTPCWGFNKAPNILSAAGSSNVTFIGSTTCATSMYFDLKNSAYLNLIDGLFVDQQSFDQVSERLKKTSDYKEGTDHYVFPNTDEFKQMLKDLPSDASVTVVIKDKETGEVVNTFAIPARYAH